MWQTVYWIYCVYAPVLICITQHMTDECRDLPMKDISKDSFLIFFVISRNWTNSAESVYSSYLNDRRLLIQLSFSPTLHVWFPCWSRPKTTRHSLAELYLPQLYHRELGSTHTLKGMREKQERAALISLSDKNTEEQSESWETAKLGCHHQKPSSKRKHSGFLSWAAVRTSRLCVCCCKGLILPMLWMAVLWQAGPSQAGRGNRGTLYNKSSADWNHMALPEIIAILGRKTKSRGKCCTPSAFLLRQPFL